VLSDPAEDCRRELLQHSNTAVRHGRPGDEARQAKQSRQRTARAATPPEHSCSTLHSAEVINAILWKLRTVSSNTASTGVATRPPATDRAVKRHDAVVPATAAYGAPRRGRSRQRIVRVAAPDDRELPGTCNTRDLPRSTTLGRTGSDRSGTARATRWDVLTVGVVAALVVAAAVVGRGLLRQAWKSSSDSRNCWRTGSRTWVPAPRRRWPWRSGSRCTGRGSPTGCGGVRPAHWPSRRHHSARFRARQRLDRHALPRDDQGPGRLARAVGGVRDRVGARYSAHGRDLLVRREPWPGMIRQWGSDWCTSCLPARELDAAARPLRCGQGRRDPRTERVACICIVEGGDHAHALYPSGPEPAGT
jgi:hypothetical protein